MYKTDNGVTVYETYDELLNAEIKELYEDSENYYFCLKPESNYDNGAWLVNKKTYKVSFIPYLDVMGKVIVDKTAHAIEFSDLKRTA